jgi:hypothetical protein
MLLNNKSNECYNTSLQYASNVIIANRARRKQIDEQSRLKERKTLQKKGLSQYDRNQFKGQDEGGARF